MNPYAIPTADLARLAPELTLCVTGTLVLLLEAFAPRLRPAFTWLALLGTGIAAVRAAASMVNSVSASLPDPEHPGRLWPCSRES